jgi:tetratricopeptide (TPR) repeat protein
MVNRLSAASNTSLKSPLLTGADDDRLPDELSLGPNQRRPVSTTEMLKGGITIQRIGPQAVANDRFTPLSITDPLTSRLSTGGIAPLLTVAQQSQQHRIGLNSVLMDFDNTTQALGADEATMAEVNAYLNVVQLQGKAPLPNVGLIQQSLSSAAQTLDRFITNAMAKQATAGTDKGGDNSITPNATVVQEWVDALLAQDIDYVLLSSAGTRLPPTPSSAVAGPSTSNVVLNGVAASQSPLAAVKQQVAQHIQQAQQSAKNNNFPQALGAVDDSLAVLQQHQDDWFRPDIKGKLLMMKAGFLEQSGQPVETVMSAWQQAASAFSDAHLPNKEAQALLAMANKLEIHAKATSQADLLDYTDTLYSEATQLHRATGHPKGLVDSLNDWATFRHSQGKATAAIPLWMEAAKASGQLQDPSLSADIWHNLGQAFSATGQASQSLSAFKSSLQHRRQANDNPLGYSQTLQAMAQLATTMGRPMAAKALLQQASQV